MDTTAEQINIIYSDLNTLIPEIITALEDDQSKEGACLYSCLKGLQNNLEEVVQLVKEVAEFAGHYDFTEQIKGNGYRCYVKVFTQSLNCTIKECKETRDNRYSLPLNTALHARNIESWSRVFASFSLIFSMLVRIHAHSGRGGLIPTHTEQLKLLQSLDSMKKLDVTAFHGRISGFQFASSVRGFMSGWCTLLAAFSELSSSGVVNNSYAAALVNVLNYMFDKEARAKRVVALASRGSFGFFTDLLHLADNRILGHLSSLTNPSLAVNIQISLPPVNLEVPTSNGDVLRITPPAAHLGWLPVNCRILCSRWRRGMMRDGGIQSHSKPSKGLLVYYHGGGFVATSSKNYEVYLNYWAMKLDAPIFCVDYNLAPEAKYPRQLEECFYAYCWALENANLLGTTAEKICFSGDSAGGNLAMGVALKCIQHGVRLPSGLFLAYTAFIVEMTLSPGRILSLIDPIIPFGFLTKCFKAYLGNIGGGVPQFLEDLVYVDENEIQQMMSMPDKFSLCSKNNIPKKELKADKTTLADSAKRAVHALIGYLTSFLSLGRGHRSLSVSLESGIVAEKCPETAIRSANGISGSKTPKKMIITTCASGNSVVKDFHDCNMSPDFYLSPFYAPTEFLSQLPKVSLITTDLDTCIDDNVVFAKKLTNCGVSVDLEILEGLPHGFLLLAQGSKDARKGSQKAIASIQSILELDES